MLNNFIDVIGIGLGPSNLALAAAFEEARNSLPAVKCVFLEKKSHFIWHPGMLLPGAKLQVTFLRDLATARNPQSPFTFLNYLKEMNRLDDFINLRTFYPSRIEFQDYLLWVSNKLLHLIEFNSNVTAIEPVFDPYDHHIKQLKINFFQLPHKIVSSYVTKQLVIGIGNEAFIPDFIDRRSRGIIHTSELTQKVSKYFPDRQKNYKFVVVGSGQSAGEAVLFLLDSYPAAMIDFCFRGFTLHSVDNNPFVNEIYYHSMIETFFSMEESAKERAHTDIANTNYSVIDPEILARLFNIKYNGVIANHERFKLYRGLQLKSVKESQQGVTALFDDLYESKIKAINADGIILATGYKNEPINPLLNTLKEFITRDSKGNFKVQQDYRLQTKEELQANIYLQGYCEFSHGPSDATLATLANKANTILQSIVTSSLA